MTWRELWQSTVTNLKALLGFSPPPPPPSPAPKRRPHALTGPIRYTDSHTDPNKNNLSKLDRAEIDRYGADSNEQGPQTIDLTPTRSIPPPTAPLRTRKEPMVPDHIAREIAAFATANQTHAQGKILLPNPGSSANLAWPRQELPNVTETDTSPPSHGPNALAQDEESPSRVREIGVRETSGDQERDSLSDYDDSNDGARDQIDDEAGDGEEFPADEEGVALTTLLESLLFVAAEPVEPSQLARTLELPADVIEQGLAELSDYYQRSLRGLRVQRYNNKVQLVTASAAAPFIEIFLNLDNSTRLSSPALETLAVIAYRQPVTRAQIEAVRGVDCAGVLRTLVQRGLVADVGRAEGVGRPILYGVTELFMQHFGLMEMAELPPLEESEADQLWAATVLEEEAEEALDPSLPGKAQPRPRT